MVRRYMLRTESGRMRVTFERSSQCASQSGDMVICISGRGELKKEGQFHLAVRYGRRRRVFAGFKVIFAPATKNMSCRLRGD